MATTEQQIEALKAEIESLKEQLKNAGAAKTKDGKFITNEEAKALRSASEDFREINFNSEKLVSYTRVLNEELKNYENQSSDLAKEIIINNEKKFKLQKEINEETNKGNNANQELITTLKEQLKDQEDAHEVLVQDSKEIIKKIELIKKQLEEEDKINAAITRRRNLHVEISDKLKNQIADSLGIGDLMGNINNKMGLMASITLKVTENATKLFGEVLEGNRQFAATTGQIAERTATFGYGLSQFGVGFKELNEASIKLYGSMSNFSNLNSEVQEKLAGNAAKMNLLGVSADTTGKNFDILTKSMKVGTEEVTKINDDLAKTAIAAGIAPSKMLAEFGPAMNSLAAYGKKGIEVFKELEKASKSLGLELGTLNSVIGEQFDTFEGSAQAAGKLNAVLGGNYLNSIEMLNATESERILMLKRSFDESGKNFDSLDKYEKKAIAATLGIRNMDEASKLFGKSTSELSSDMAQQAASQADLEKVQREAAETQKQMNEIFNGFLIIIRPLVEVVKMFVNALTFLNDKTGGAIGGILAFTAGFYALSKAYVAAGGISGVTEKITGFGQSIKDAAGKVKDFFTSSEGLGERFKKLLPGGTPPAAPNVPVPGNLGEAQRAAAQTANTPMAGFKAFMKGLIDGLKQWASADGLKALGGAVILSATMVVLGAGLGLAGMLMTKFSDPTAVLAFSASILILALGLKAVGNVATADMIVKAAILTLAIGIMAIGLFAMGKVFEIFSGIDYGNVMMGVIATGLILLAIIGLGMLMSGPAIGFLIVGTMAMGILAAGLLVLGLALIVFGAGINAVFGPLTSFAEKIDSVMKITIGIGLLAASFATLALIGSNPIFMVALVVGVAAMTASLLGLAVAIDKLPLEKANALIELMNKIKESMNFELKINTPVSMIEGINKALSELQETKAITLTASLEALNESIRLTNEDPKKIETTTTFFNTVKEYYTAQAASKDSDKDALVAALKELKDIMNPFGGGAGGKKEIPIVLRIGNAKDIRAALETKVGEQNQ